MKTMKTVRNWLVGLLMAVLGSVALPVAAQAPALPNIQGGAWETILPAIDSAFQAFRDSYLAWPPGPAPWQTTIGDALIAGGVPADIAATWTDAVIKNDLTTYREAWRTYLERRGLSLDGGSSPQSGSAQVQRAIVNQLLFQKAEPVRAGAKAKEGKTGAGKAPLLKVVGTDVSTTLWKYDTGSKGKTFGVTPTFAVGETSQFSLSLPLYQMDVWRQDKEILTYGLDGRFKQKVTANLSLGGHANYLQTYYGTGSADKREASATAGPFVSYNVPLTERLNLSFGGMVDYTNPEWSRDFWTGALGANLGVKLLDNLVLNPYVIYFRTLDRAKDDVDNDFWDAGVELKALLGDSWTVAVGTRTTLGYVNYKSYGVYLGTTWQF